MTRAALVTSLDPFAVPPTLPLPFFNVQNYGAIGNGAADDTAALQAALDAANNASGGIVIIPPGTYIVSATLTLRSGIRILGAGPSTTIKAKDAANFQHVLSGASVSNIVAEFFMIDVNQANRVGVLTTTGNGVNLVSCSDVTFAAVLIKNAIGKNAATGFGFASTLGTRIRAESCSFLNNGIVGNIADGIYMSGDRCFIVNCIAESCLDTGFAMEACNFSGIIDCVAKDCGAAAAIVNNAATDSVGNYIDGLSVSDWLASNVTGAVWIGLSGASTGNLVNTRLANVQMTRTLGGGPAINLRRAGGTGRIAGISLSNIRVQHPNATSVGTQALLVDVTDGLNVGTSYFRTTSNSSAIQVLAGSTNVRVKGCELETGGQFGAYIDGASDVEFIGNTVLGKAGTTTHGIYFDNAGTNAIAIGNYVRDASTADIGNHASTSPVVSGVSSSGYVYTNTPIAPQNTAAKIYAGSGTPEGAIVAAIGSMYLRTNGGAATTLYVKESGAGNTGWIAK